MVVQIVGIASYISVEAELLGRQEVEQEIEPKREVLGSQVLSQESYRGGLPKLKLRYRSE